jgi:hypothetical protein
VHPAEQFEGDLGLLPLRSANDQAAIADEVAVTPLIAGAVPVERDLRRLHHVRRNDGIDCCQPDGLLSAF